MFPADKLTASGGEIYCHLFENPQVGVPRNVYWSIRIDFHPIHYEGQDWRCSMTCEWLTWPLRDWRELSGRSLNLNYGDRGSEASFYMCEHDLGKSTRLNIGARAGSSFDVAMEMVVDFAGYTGTDENPAMVVRGRATVPYTGVIVVPDNLSSRPNTLTEVSSAVAAYLDTMLLKAPERRSHAFWMEPMAGI
jgi:hypothetical protein